MSAVFQKTLSATLALFFAIMAGWQGASSLASPAFTTSPPPCHCCSADRSSCATPACCARPSDDRAPVTPTAPRFASGQEWHVIAPPALTLLTLHAPTLHRLFICRSPVQPGAVPIFQWGCSYLL